MYQGYEDDTNEYTDNNYLPCLQMDNQIDDAEECTPEEDYQDQDDYENTEAIVDTPAQTSRSKQDNNTGMEDEQQENANYDDLLYDAYQQKYDDLLYDAYQRKREANRQDSRTLQEDDQQEDDDSYEAMIEEMQISRRI